MLRIDRVSVTTRRCLLGPTVMLVSLWLPATAWAGVVYLSRSLHLGTIEQ